VDIELLCNGRMHGIVTDGSGLLEVKCSHIACTGRQKAVILHTFDLATGLIKHNSEVFSTDFWRKRRNIR
jgi:hypothetical protein